MARNSNSKNTKEIILDTAFSFLEHPSYSSFSMNELAAKVEAAGYDVFIKPKDIVIPSNPEFHVRMSFFYGPLGEQVELFNPQE